MDKQLSKLKSSKNKLKKVGTAVTFGTVGEVVGLIAAQFISDAFLPDYLIAHGTGVLFGLIGTLFFSSKYNTEPGKTLRDCLSDADLMFLDNLIDEKQRLRMRDSCMEKFLKSNE